MLEKKNYKSFPRLPYSGDSVPNVLKFFRDSQLITSLLLFESIILKIMIVKSSCERPYLWLQSTVTFATKNRAGEFFLASSSPKVEDVTELVESVKALSSDEVIWLTFCKLVDRVLFFVIFVLYFIMFVSLLPEGYLKASYDPIETSNA